MMCREVERSSLPSFYGTHLSAQRGIYCVTLLVLVFKIISPFRFLSMKKQDWDDVFFPKNQLTDPIKFSVKTWQWPHVYFLAIEVNNDHFLGAMWYHGFFPREPLASMVFRWFCSPLTITINYFFNNWPLDSMVFQWFWGHSTIAI